MSARPTMRIPKRGLATKTIHAKMILQNFSKINSVCIRVYIIIITYKLYHLKKYSNDFYISVKQQLDQSNASEQQRKQLKRNVRISCIWCLKMFTHYIIQKHQLALLINFSNFSGTQNAWRPLQTIRRVLQLNLRLNTEYVRYIHLRKVHSTAASGIPEITRLFNFFDFISDCTYSCHESIRRSGMETGCLEKNDSNIPLKTGSKEMVQLNLILCLCCEPLSYRSAWCGFKFSYRAFIYSPSWLLRSQIQFYFLEM